MDLNNESLHRLTPKTEDPCTESHIILSPPYNENGETYSVFKILQNTGDTIYVIDDLDNGITLRLENVYTEIEELIPEINYSPEHLTEYCNIKVYKVMKTLPSIVSLKRIPKFSNEICIMKIGNSPVGLFYIDIVAKKILKTEIFNEDIFKTNFPKILDGYSYSDLEAIMRSYTGKDDNLEDIINNIQDEGFFNPIRPGLKILIETVEFDSFSIE